MKLVLQAQVPDTANSQVHISADSLLSDTSASAADSIAAELLVFDSKSIVNIDSILWKKLPALSPEDSASLGIYYRESLIKGNAHQTQLIEPEEKTIVKHHFVIYSLVLIFGLTAVSRYFDRQKFKNYLLGLFRKKEFEKFMREDGFEFLPPNVIWFSICCMVNALFFAPYLQIPIPLDFAINLPIKVGILLPAFAMIFLMKGIVLWLVGKVFSTEKEAAVHVLVFYNAVFLLSFAEFVLITFQISGFFINTNFELQSIGIALIVSIIYISLQLLTGIRFKNLQDILYFILYLCTLEILPFVTLGFWAINLN